MGLLAAFQVDIDALFAWTVVPQPSLWIGAAGSGAGDRHVGAVRGGPAGSRPAGPAGRIVERTIADTNFVTVWVVLAFLGYELGVALTGVDLKAAFAVWGPVVPLIAILVGLLPGCGPQVLVTTLYLTGVVLLSAQIGNAVSNDGDALFPALAVAPKARWWRPCTAPCRP